MRSVSARLEKRGGSCVVHVRPESLNVNDKGETPSSEGVYRPTERGSETLSGVYSESLPLKGIGSIYFIVKRSGKQYKLPLSFYCSCRQTIHQPIHPDLKSISRLGLYI